jgi:hypothetical protein
MWVLVGGDKLINLDRFDRIEITKTQSGVWLSTAIKGTAADGEQDDREIIGSFTSREDAMEQLRRIVKPS